MNRKNDGPPRLTDEQRRSLSVAGASVALSAGAGCGKTTVLTSRFLGALDGDGSLNGRRPLWSLVALTFTEKAARELRQRIRGECHRRLERAEGDDVAHWLAVLRGLEAAPVSTFHEYCASLLRRHALDAGVDPDFQVLDAAIAETVLDEALTRCVRGWLSESNADLIELAVEYGLRSVRDALGTLVAARDAGDLSAWTGRSAGEVVAAWQDFWQKTGRPSLVRKFLGGAGACRSLLAVNTCRHPAMSTRRLLLLEAFEDLERDKEPAPALDVILENAKVQGGGKAEYWPSPEVYEEVKDGLTKLRGSVKALADRLNVDNATTLRCAEHGLRFARLAADARRGYDEAKRARGGLDFDDLLVKTRGLLGRGAGAPAGHPGEALAFVLVDEFQDTDPVQSDILRSLGGDEFARGRLFVVGDFKQSIYRFRGARPQLFQDVRAEFPAEGRHDLTENFRSAVGVVDFVNALFAEAFPGETPRLVPGPHAAPAAEGPAVEFVWAEESAEGEECRGKSGAAEMRPTEARWLARLIRGRLDAGWPVRDRGSKTVRNAHAGDVAFLFRAMTDLAPYESALQTEGLDFHVVGGKAFYAQQEVQDLVNVLSVIEDPVDPVSLAGALRGPFFGLSDDALFRLGAGPFDLAEGLDRAGSIDALSAIDRQRAGRARELLSAWRGLKDRLPIAELVDRVLDESGFEAALLGEFLGDRKRANARKLVRLARRFDARGGFTLGHFVTRLREDLRRPPREEQASTTEEEGESVRLMSIHQAKGLEFPIVVIPD
ncbi:MAG: UvrD-helicase domain-containing protein, partial [Planctomycetia bacterium]|nr:UvrD-helicase domain-containing protein [Planctomycetia bacterium]